MTKISIYFDGFFNDSNNYISYSFSEILVNEFMSFKDLYNIIRSKLGCYIDIYLCYFLSSMTKIVEYYDGYLIQLIVSCY